MSETNVVFPLQISSNQFLRFITHHCLQVFNSVEVVTRPQQAVATTITTTSPAPLLKQQTLENLHSKPPTVKGIIG
jgi:hypothetical protein